MGSSKFKVGDVVKLKSGGPKMTISWLGANPFGAGEELAKCEWFEGNKARDREYPITILAKADEAVDG